MSGWIEPVSQWLGIPEWVFQAFFVVLAAFLLEVLYRVFVARLDSIAKKTARLWDDAIVYAGKRPISFLIWWQGVVMAARVISPNTDAFGFEPELLNAIGQLGLVLAGTWFGVRLTTGFERAFVDQRQRKNKAYDITTLSVLGRVVRIAVVLTGVLTTLSILEIPISGFLAAGGVSGIAVGLAARELLANFFGGLMVFMDRPFSVGDWIRSPDKDIEGTVEAIGWRVTTVRKFDKRPMYVPNATFATVTLENPSRMTHRRIFDQVGIRYDDQALIEPIVADIRQMLLAHPDIATDQTLMVHFNAYGASSLDIMIYCFTQTREWQEYHRVREDVLLKVGAIIERHGAEIAFPTRTLKLDQMDALVATEGHSPQ